MRELVHANSHLLCPVCQQLMNDPVITRCSHSFCRTCLERAVSADQFGRCPSCRTVVDASAVHDNLLVRQMIDESLVYCENRSLGCLAQFRLCDASAHQCAFSMASCRLARFGCGFRGSHDECVQHVQSSCPFAQIEPFLVHQERLVAGLVERVSQLEAQISTLSGGATVPDAADRQGQGSGTTTPTSTGSSMEQDGSAGSSSVLLGPSQRDAALLRCRRVLGPHASPVSAVAVVGGGSVVSACYDGTIHVWDALGAHQRVSFKDRHLAPVWKLALSAENPAIMLSTGSDSQLSQWDIAAGAGGTCAGTRVASVPVSPGKVYAMTQLAGTIITSGADRMLRIWGVSDLSSIAATPSQHAGTVWNLLPAPDAATVWSCSEDGMVRRFSAASSGLQADVCVDISKTTLSLAHVGGRLFVGTSSGAIHAFDPRQPPSPLSPAMDVLEGHSWDCWQLVGEGNFLYSGSFDHSIRVWDVRRMRALTTLSGHKGWLHALALGDQQLYSGSFDKTVRCWSPSDAA